MRALPAYRRKLCLFESSPLLWSEWPSQELPLKVQHTDDMMNAGYGVWCVCVRAWPRTIVLSLHG